MRSGSSRSAPATMPTPWRNSPSSRSAAPKCSAPPHRASRQAEPAVLHRHRQGRRGEGSQDRARRRRDPGQPHPDPGAGAQPRKALRVPRGRPHRAHSRHLRAARARTKASCRSSRAAQAHGDAPRARLDSPRAPARRRDRPRGPGETQLETDRRLLQKRLEMLESASRKPKSSAPRRRARLRGHVPVVALVGYTNAGKSTLSSIP